MEKYKIFLLKMELVYCSFRKILKNPNFLQHFACLKRLIDKEIFLQGGVTVKLMKLWMDKYLLLTSKIVAIAALGAIVFVTVRTFVM